MRLMPFYIKRNCLGDNDFMLSGCLLVTGTQNISIREPVNAGEKITLAVLWMMGVVGVLQKRTRKGWPRIIFRGFTQFQIRMS